MKIRKQIKEWLYGSCPGFAGAFPYYGTKVYFPKNSLIFKIACEQGIYEKENIHILSSLIKPDSVYFDVGANIGLMAIPVLHQSNSCTVVSFEPSPTTLQFLTRTVKESEFSDRWQLIGKAAGSSMGTLDFFTASNDLGALDGFQDTKRAGEMSKITVPVTTLDAEWLAMDKPSVSAIKLDIEGAELAALEGALQCITTERPCILTEWNPVNLKAYDCDPKSLLNFVEKAQYKIFSLPYLIPVHNSVGLKTQMMTTESFLLLPDDG
jgi:FkbM family methyltransferase